MEKSGLAAVGRYPSLRRSADRQDFSTTGVALPRLPVEMTLFRRCIQATFITDMFGAAPMLALKMTGLMR